MIQSWYRKLVGPAQPSSRRERRQGGPRRAGFRPRLEFLEERTLLSAGSLDPHFGTGGTAVIPFPTPNGPPSAASASAIAVQGDKTVLAGSDFNVTDSFGDFAVARLNKDGSLDQSFGTGGEVTISFGQNTQAGATAVAVQGNKIVVAGFSVDFDTGQQVFAVARLNRDGSLDQGFGTGGEVTITFTGSDAAAGVAIQGNKIVVAGTTFLTNGNEDVAVARLNKDGSLDSRFGTGGEVTFGFGTSTIGTASAVAIQDDRILVAGGASAGGSSDFAVARLNKDGSLDQSFGTGGEVTFKVGNGGPASSMALQGDKIVLAGSVGSTDPNVVAQFGVARLNRDGSLDTTFGQGGQVTFTFASAPGETDFASAVTVQGDEIVVAGTAQNTTSDLAVARLNKDGSLDSTFGSGGKVTTDFPGSSAFGAGVVVQDGDIIVAGTLLDNTTNENDFLAAAYLKN
jgi:uncharacterized delta-60 repeat protein